MFPQVKHSFKFTPRQIIILFLISVGLWAFAFRGYLSGHYSLQADAVPYYEHIKFYTDQLGQGVYPVWDPSRDFGVPNEFYLRRIGSFNPFYFLIVVLVKLGVKFMAAYQIFLSLYYFLGMIGFYKLGKLFWDDDSMAAIGYLLLVFSSTATLLFSSFIILIITPIIWFFYFLLSFARIPNKRDLLGLTFALMLIVSTYVPFYFFFILMVAVILWACIYFQETKKTFHSAMRFFTAYKVFTFICLCAFLLSLLPGILFYIEAGKGEVVMNVRHKHSDSANILEVVEQNYIEGGILVTTLLNELTDNLKNYQLGQVYVPFMAHIFFFLGLLAAVNRRIFFISLFCFFFYLVGLYEATPIYGFLYEHLFFIKYMRNFQYFLWLVLLPGYLLLAVEHLRQWVNSDHTKKVTQIQNITSLVFVHIGILIFLTQRQETLVSSYVLTGVSFIIFTLMFIESSHRAGYSNWRIIFLSIVAVLIVAQPLEVYNYLRKSSDVRVSPYRYDEMYLTIRVPDRQSVLKTKSDEESYVAAHNLTWFSVKWIENLKARVSPSTLNKSFDNGLVVYDNVELINEEHLTDKDYQRIEKTLWDGVNTAFVSVNSFEEESVKRVLPQSFLTNTENPGKAMIVTTDDREIVDIRRLGTNRVQFDINFPDPKFFVYHDSYHKDWRAFIDGRPVDIFRASLAFKGVVIPSGKHVLEFKFGNLWQAVFQYCLLIVYFLVFVFLVRLFQKSAMSLNDGRKNFKK